MAGGTVERLRSLVVSNSGLKPLLKAIGNARCQAWDLIHGADTCGDVPLATLDFQSHNKAAGLEYQSHHPKIIRAGLAALEIRPENFTFIDFGCGKGRVLLVASEFRVRTVAGRNRKAQSEELSWPGAEVHSDRSHNRRCHRVRAHARAPGLVFLQSLRAQCFGSDYAKHRGLPAAIAEGVAGVVFGRS